MPRKYDKMTTEDFDRLLVDIIDAASTPELLAVAGVYEVLAEHYNNDVLEAWDAEQEAGE